MVVTNIWIRSSTCHPNCLTSITNISSPIWWLILYESYSKGCWCQTLYIGDELIRSILVTYVGDGWCWWHVCDDSATSWNSRHHEVTNITVADYNAVSGDDKDSMLVAQSLSWWQRVRVEWQIIWSRASTYFSLNRNKGHQTLGWTLFEIAQLRNIFAEEDYKFQNEVPTSLNFNHFNFISLLILFSPTNLLTFYWMYTAWSKLIMINVLLSKS